MPDCCREKAIFDFAAWEGKILSKILQYLPILSGYGGGNSFKFFRYQNSSMKQSFTLNQCVRLIFGETTPAEGAMLREIISGNVLLKAEFENMQEVVSAMSMDFLSPRHETTKSILKYSRDTALHLSC